MNGRAVIAISVCLLGGILLNIAVAIGCVIAAQQWPAPVPELLQDGHRSELSERYHHGSYQPHRVRNWGARTERPGYHELTFLSMAILRDVHECVKIVEIEAGFPLVSMRRHVRTNIEASEWPGQLYSFLMQPRLASADAELFLFPTAPIWKGFLLNSLLYAAALWTLFLMPLAIRRVARSRRGLCLRCAYPIGVSDVCTECGAAVPARMTGHS